MPNENDYCIWYTDKLKDINNKIWKPNNLVNKEIKNIFTNKNIKFKVMENINSINNELQLKKFKLNNKTIAYKTLVSNYFKTIITNYTKHIKDSNEYINQKPLDFINKNIYNQIYAKAKKRDKTLIKNKQHICESLRSHKILIKLSKIQKDMIKVWMNKAAEVYNICVEKYNNNPKFASNFINAKKIIMNEINYENIPYDILVYEIKQFYENISSCFTNLKNGNIDKFEIKNKNIKRNQTITIYKNAIKNKGIYPTYLNNIKDFNQIVDIYKIKSDCKLTWDKTNDNFYLYIPHYIKCKETIINDIIKICALDPGEKIFQTIYSLIDCGFIGEDIRIPILKYQSKIKKYQRLLNKKKTTKGNRINKRKIKAKINKLYKKIKGLVNELHKKTALYLCKNYNIILIPEFKTQEMISDKVISKNKFKENVNKIKEENKVNAIECKEKLKTYKRKIRLNSRVKFVLNQLSHYKFKQQLFSKAEEYGCLCVQVTEEYTSQLCSTCGKLSKKYKGREKECTHCGKTIHRDINGSRNILLKNIVDHISEKDKIRGFHLCQSIKQKGSVNEVQFITNCNKLA